MCTLDKVKEFYFHELISAKRAFEVPELFDPKHVLTCGLQRALGVATFVQMFNDVTFEEVDTTYNRFKETLYDIYEKARLT